MIIFKGSFGLCGDAVAQFVFEGRSYETYDLRRSCAIAACGGLINVCDYEKM
jgi:hypothetical protein